MIGSWIVILAISASMHCTAQGETTLLPPPNPEDTISRGPYTLIFKCNDPSFSPITRQRMIDAFFIVYPKEADRFNRNTLRQVVFFIDPDYKGVAETGNGVARYNPEWLRSHPEDIDVVTHEVMHIVQNYHHHNPGWLTEGIADYVRYIFGVNNSKGAWRLPDYRPGQNYRNAYRITARFLVWAEQNKAPTLVDQLDTALRNGSYTPSIWTKLTGKSVDALWEEYSNNPAVKLTYQ